MPSAVMTMRRSSGRASAANPKIAWSCSSPAPCPWISAPRRRPIRITILMSAWAASLFAATRSSRRHRSWCSGFLFGSGPTSAAPLTGTISLI